MEALFDYEGSNYALLLAEFFFVIYMGLVLGSFSTALTYRVPRKISWIGSYNSSAEPSVARSACPHCHTVLKWHDLIPVFSWLFSAGRCRYCRAPIGWRYPLIEILTLLGCVGIFSAYGLSAASILMLLMMPFLIALLFIDIEHMILPNQLVAIVGALGCMMLVWEGFLMGWSDAYIGFALSRTVGFCIYGGIIYGLGAIMKAFLKKEALGFGDVKFFAVSGLWLGLDAMPVFFILSGIFGVVFALGWKIVRKSKVFPFGPALMTALYTILLLNGYGIDLYKYFPKTVFF